MKKYCHTDILIIMLIKYSILFFKINDCNQLYSTRARKQYTMTSVSAVNFTDSSQTLEPLSATLLLPLPHILIVWYRKTCNTKHKNAYYTSAIPLNISVGPNGKLTIEDFFWHFPDSCQTPGHFQVFHTSSHHVKNSGLVDEMFKKTTMVCLYVSQRDQSPCLHLLTQTLLSLPPPSSPPLQQQQQQQQ